MYNIGEMEELTASCLVKLKSSRSISTVAGEGVDLPQRLVNHFVTAFLKVLLKKSWKSKNVSPTKL